MKPSFIQYRRKFIYGFPVPEREQKARKRQEKIQHAERYPSVFAGLVFIRCVIMMLRAELAIWRNDGPGQANNPQRRIETYRQ